MVFVLCAGTLSPICWAGNLQQAIELESEDESSSPDDDISKTGFMPGLAAHGFLSPGPTFAETLSPAGSDAYSSIILHGPPVRYYSA